MITGHRSDAERWRQETVGVWCVFGDWILKWLEDPQAIEPGTKMPMYWAPGEPSPVPHLDGDPQRQREAIRDYMFSLGSE